MLNNTTKARHHGSVGFIILSFALILSISIIPALAKQLTDLEWQTRPLLLFAPDHQDMRLVQTLQHLQQNNCDIDDRDMIIGIIVTHGRSTLTEQAISERCASALCSQYGITNDHFIALLIGKALNITKLKSIGLIAIGREFNADLCISKIAFYR